MKHNSCHIPKDVYHKIEFIPLGNEPSITQANSPIARIKLPISLKSQRYHIGDLEDICSPLFGYPVDLTTGEVVGEVAVVGGFAFMDNELGSIYGQYTRKGIVTELAYHPTDIQSPHFATFTEMLQAIHEELPLLMIFWNRGEWVSLDDTHLLEHYLITSIN